MARYACGLGEGTVVSPLHAALLAATVANQGRMMAPYFVREIRNIRADVLGRAVPRVLRTAITPQTATRLKDFMVNAAQHALGAKAKTKTITVAGKTGTS